MAHGKSLEKTEIPKPQVLCTCGEVWESEAHFTKKGQLRKNLNQREHQVTSGRRGRSSGYRRPSVGFVHSPIVKGRGMASIFGPPMPSRKVMRMIDKGQITEAQVMVATRRKLSEAEIMEQEVGYS